MPAGRPTKYKPEYAKQAKKLCELGATEIDLAEFFEVDLSTITRWKSRYKQFCISLKVGKGAPDDRVERSLYERATGYTTTETKTFLYKGEVITEDVLKHYPPDSVACMYWLNNRRPEEYRNKKEVTTNNDEATSILKEIAEKLPE